MKKLFSLLVMSLLLSGCDEPSESGMLKQYQAFSQSDDLAAILYKVSHHKQLDGFEQSDEMYVADMSHQVTFLMNYDDFSQHLIEQDALLAPLYLMHIRTHFGDFQQGDIQTVTNRVTFVKRDSGWALLEEGLID